MQSTGDTVSGRRGFEERNDPRALLGQVKVREESGVVDRGFRANTVIGASCIFLHHVNAQ